MPFHDRKSISINRAGQGGMAGQAVLVTGDRVRSCRENREWG